MNHPPSPPLRRVEADRREVGVGGIARPGLAELPVRLGTPAGGEEPLGDGAAELVCGGMRGQDGRPRPWCAR